MRFDWYQTTITAHPDSVLEAVASLGQSLKPADSLARMYRGERGYQVLSEEGAPVATFISGGSYGSDRVHAWASSDDTEAFVDMVRGEWPDDHIVTRVDACEDFYDSKARNSITRTMRRFAKEKGIRFEVRAKPLDKTLGETFYMGGNKSEMRVRGYDKGYEVYNRFKDIFERDGYSIPIGVLTTNDGKEVKPEDWFRVELQARPKDKVGRSIASKLTPKETWALGSWTNEFARQVFALELERAYMRQKKVTKYEQQLRWMCAQYSRPLLALIESSETYEHAIQHLLDIIEQQGRM